MQGHLVQVGLGVCLSHIAKASLIDLVSADHLQLQVVERFGPDALLESAHLGPCPQLHTECLPSNEIHFVRAAD